jgi:hypothetical protein
VSNRINPWDTYDNQRIDPRKTRKTQSARNAASVEEQQEREDEARRGPRPLVKAALAGRPSPEDVQRWTTFLPRKPPGRGT